MNSRKEPAPARDVLGWFIGSTAGMAVLLLLALAVGCAVVWVIHPTIPPRLFLLEPEEGTWNWLLHNVFVGSRSLAALAAVMAAVVLLFWWIGHAISQLLKH